MAAGSWRERRRLVYEARHRLDRDYLIDALSDTDVRVRRAAAMHLGDIRERSAVDPLLRLLNVRDEPLRIIAIKSLAAIGDSAAGPRLVELADDEAEALPTRTTAMVALAELGHPAATDLLAGLSRHPKRSYRKWAMRKLREIGDPPPDSLRQDRAVIDELRMQQSLPDESAGRAGDGGLPPESDPVSEREERAPRMFIDEGIAYGLTRELSLYESLLDDGERAIVVASAARFLRTGLLIVTDRRVVFFRESVFFGSPTIRAFRYGEIRDVKPGRWGDMGVLRIRTSRRRLSFRYLRPPSTAEVVAAEISRFLPPEGDR